jgi:NAD(P)-dependent dehydrogenase (short-subunit alcohol dehydrogenase family)
MTGSTKRVNVVTGGASGIGATCIGELARNGDLVAKE